MKIRNILTRLVKSVFQTIGYTIYKKLPFGVCVFDDLKFTFPNYNFDVFFDIGANIGQSALEIRKYFKHSSIYSF